MNVDIGIGVMEGRVICQWKDPTSQIEFDAQNAYLVGVSLCKAALEAHRGSPDTGNKDLMFIAEELASQKIEISDIKRAALINQVASIIRSLTLQKKSEGYVAMHCVDAVLQETAR